MCLKGRRLCRSEKSAKVVVVQVRNPKGRCGEHEGPNESE